MCRCRRCATLWFEGERASKRGGLPLREEERQEEGHTRLEVFGFGRSERRARDGWLLARRPNQQQPVFLNQREGARRFSPKQKAKPEHFRAEGKRRGGREEEAVAMFFFRDELFASEYDLAGRGFYQAGTNHAGTLL
jgi:hypothetical protein